MLVVTTIFQRGHSGNQWPPVWRSGQDLNFSGQNPEFTCMATPHDPTQNLTKLYSHLCKPTGNYITDGGPKHTCYKGDKCLSWCLFLKHQVINYFLIQWEVKIYHLWKKWNILFELRFPLKGILFKKKSLMGKIKMTPSLSNSDWCLKHSPLKVQCLKWSGSII